MEAKIYQPLTAALKCARFLDQKKLGVAHEFYQTKKAIRIGVQGSSDFATLHRLPLRRAFVG